MTTQRLEIAPGLKAFNLHVPTPGDYSDQSRENISDLSEEEDDREEGEISEEGEVQGPITKTKRNQRRHQRQAKKRKHGRVEKAQKLEEAKQQLKSVFAAIYNCPVDEMHIHMVQPSMLVLAVKITSWERMPRPTKTEVQDCLQTVMDIGDNSYAIKNNAAARHSTPTSGPSSHGSRGDQPPSVIQPRGVMYGIGWHLSQEPGKSLVNYAPRQKDEKYLDAYLDLNAKLPRVAALYRHGLACLFPGGGQAMQGVADREGVVSFADALDGAAPERPFANSLTTTHCGFCNHQHCDKDFCPLAYGMWWAACDVAGRWTFSPDADHHQTMGGEFGCFWNWGRLCTVPPPFSSTLNSTPNFPHSRARGLVEIFWRGQLDFHGTLSSTDIPGYTRFGTSIQITAKGVNAMHKVWNVDELAACGHDVHKLNLRNRITTAQDRADKARKDNASKNKNKS
ncbi:hypothetical protein DFH07DRAFT_967638 [Mycena maculata]|uniref:Tet-like 2OG-Fe(II) oxygenase domain-containing protein n=1 Tax=Mycena maculata TaxID=230809 RepID=A0AAD7I4U5_9AGAR|nr:hypothetical protein DFH07DRAFT_967638 [Mycena maculata]